MHESKISNRSVLTVTAIGLVASISFPHGAQAQSKQDAVGGILGLIGNISQGAAKSKAQKGWAQTGEPVRACINTMFSEKNLSVEQLAAAGVGPTDPRIAQLVTSCNQIMSAQLQTNISCNVTNSKGHQVQSLCNQVFAKEENGKISEVSREDFLRAAARGEKVQVALLETSVANSARLNEERRLAEVERQAFLASPEGKRQAAADAARARKAAADQAARQKAAEVTRRQAEIAENLCDKAVEARFPPASIFYAGLYRTEGSNLVYRYAIRRTVGTDLYACTYSPTTSRVLSVKYDEPD